jgi:hypothetical protein
LQARENQIEKRIGRAQFRNCATNRPNSRAKGRELAHSGQILASETGGVDRRLHAERTATFTGLALESGHSAYGHLEPPGCFAPKSVIEGGFSIAGTGHCRRRPTGLRCAKSGRRVGAGRVCSRYSGLFVGAAYFEQARNAAAEHAKANARCASDNRHRKDEASPMKAALSAEARSRCTVRSSPGSGARLASELTGYDREVRWVCSKDCSDPSRVGPAYRSHFNAIAHADQGAASADATTRSAKPASKNASAA